MAIVCRAMALADLDTAITDGEVTTVLSAFTDSDQLKNWAKNSAAVVIKNGIIKGSNGMLRPTAKISRAETAVMIKQLLAKAELI